MSASSALHLWVVLAPVARVVPSAVAGGSSPGAESAFAVAMVGAVDVDAAAKLAAPIVAQQFPASEGWTLAGAATALQAADDLVRHVAASLDDRRIISLH